MTDHYFTDSPAATAAERRRLEVTLGGRAVTVETAGGTFSPTGLDKATQILLDEVPAPPPSGTALDLGCGWGPIATTLAQMPKPVIAAVNGVAAGAGLSLAMLADFRIAAPTAKFTTAFAGIGLSCDTGASWSLQRLVGSARARELLFDARTIDADEALRIGLVNRIEDDALAAAQSWAARLAAGPTLAYAAMRDALEFASNHSLVESLAHEEPLMIRTGSSDDHRRAVDAFLTKQPPTFEGR